MIKTRRFRKSFYISKSSAPPMANFWRLVNEVIEEADMILLVTDARMVEETRNIELVKKVAAAKKQLITVINKADLVDKNKLEHYAKKYHPCVFVSAQKFYGMTILRHAILRYAEKTPVVIGVVGYPNTGKSSVINALKGKSSAKVSSVSGYTKAKQLIRVDRKILLIDTPGVLAGKDDKSSEKLKIAASLNVNKDPDLAAYKLLELYGREIADFYSVEYDENVETEELLERIARKLNRFKKGGDPDIDTTARMVLQDWQKARIQV